MCEIVRRESSDVRKKLAVIHSRFTTDDSRLTTHEKKCTNLAVLVDLRLTIRKKATTFVHTFQ